MNWVKETLRDHGQRDQVNFTASGGSDRIRYYSLLNFISDKGLLKNTDQDSYSTQFGNSILNVRTNLDIDITASTHVKVNLSGKIKEKYEPGGISDEALMGIGCRIDHFGEAHGSCDAMLIRNVNISFPLFPSFGFYQHDSIGSSYSVRSYVWAQSEKVTEQTDEQADETTIAASSVDNKELMKRSNINPANALFGKLNGLFIRQNGGYGNGEGNPSMNIRGIGSLVENSILVLVDGLERDINSLVLEEIEDVTILKDAAVVVSSACSSVCSVTFSLCAQTGGITHRKDSDMIGINLFLILFFKFSIRNKGYHHPGFWIRPYALLISLLGNALRYHLGENLPGLAHCLSSPFSAGLNNLYS